MGPKRFLLIEGNQEEVELINQFLIKCEPQFQCEAVSNLESAIDYLTSEKFDIVLVDLGQSEITDLSLFINLRNYVQEIPIVVLVEPEQEFLGVKACQSGAQDYFIKDYTDVRLFKKIIRYALEQSAIENELRSLKLIDERTGLYTRRAFLVLGQHYLRLANRTARGLILFYILLTRGGDDVEIVKAVAHILRQSFRRSDIIACFGGGQFFVLALESHKDSVRIITTRLKNNLNVLNIKQNNLSGKWFDISAVFYEPGSRNSISFLIAQAYKLIEEQV